MKFSSFKKFSALVALSTASVYYAQAVKDSTSHEKSIDQVVLTGVADIAKDRKTPVAVSTIKEAQIIEKMGNQEFPEILNTTPSVYASKGGGGFGDSRLNIRGFEQANIAVMINGVPVNDMESGAVYWSNWAGLSDVTSALQVQRGLGASKLAIASVGGTVNVVTRSADKKEGGLVSAEVGNNDYLKTLFAYNSGLNAKGWSTSILMSRTAGSTYVQGTKFEGYNYYWALGYKHGAHDFQFTITGAPQWHDQRSTSPTIFNYIKYNPDHDGTPDRTYNQDYGYYGNTLVSNKINYYHKPVISLNWDWKMSPSSKLNTVLYASFGRGGGTSDNGRLAVLNTNGTTSYNGVSGFTTPDGHIDFNSIYARNAAVTNYKENVVSGANYANTLVERSNINSHNWFGIISSFNHKITDNLNFTLGIDGRYYKGYHYQQIVNFYGANGYYDSYNKNVGGRLLTPSQVYTTNPDWNPFGGKLANMADRDSYSYHSDVAWYGGFGQLEYSNEKLSVYLQGAISDQGYQRTDDFIIGGKSLANGQITGVTVVSPAGQPVVYAQPTATNPALPTSTGFKYLFGYNAKGGINFNIDDHNNIFGNIGYYSKQPFLNAVYPGNKNLINPNLTNEKIFGAELGYGYRSKVFNANINLYRTEWKDRFLNPTVYYTDATSLVSTQGYANILGVTELHQGIEIDANVKPAYFLTFAGSLSLGNWYYKGNATGTFYDQNNNPANVANNSTNTTTMYLDKVKVGNAAQTSASISAILEPVKNLKFDATYRYYDKLYANLSPGSFTSVTAQQLGAVRLPHYGLTDLGLSYKFFINDKQSFTVRGNVYNLFDKTYIQESYSSIQPNMTYNQWVANTNANVSSASNIATAQKNYATYVQQGTYNGVSQANAVYFGFGRTWAATLAFNF